MYDTSDNKQVAIQINGQFDRFVGRTFFFSFLFRCLATERKITCQSECHVQQRSTTWYKLTFFFCFRNVYDNNNNKNRWRKVIAPVEIVLPRSRSIRYVCARNIPSTKCFYPPAVLVCEQVARGGARR
jgi:hypothetical protein